MKITSLKKRRKNLKNCLNKFNKILLIIISILFINLSCASSSFSEENLKAKHQIDNLMEDLFNYVKSNKIDKKTNKDQTIKLVQKYLNLDFMARATSGHYWKKASEEQKSKYKNYLIHKIINTINLHLNTLEDMTFQNTNVEKRGKKLIYVKGFVKSMKNDRKKIKLMWKIFSKDYSILDLEVEKISLIRTQKSETMSSLRKNKGDFSQLFENLKKINTQ